MESAIRFVHLGIDLPHVGQYIRIFGFEVAYYGIVIACAMLAGIGIAMWTAKKTGQDPDLYFDFAIIAIVVSLIGARLYYVIFSWSYYKDRLLEILNFRGGGLAIYGGVIAGILTCAAFSRIKRQNLMMMLDTACIGLILGQAIGRWGNFFNREAFGCYTDSLFAMQIPADAVRSSEISAQAMAHTVTIEGVEFIQVHPTFLYESMWNLAVLAILLTVTLKIRKRFDGEVFLLYIFGYSLGRLWIEGLRTDQLLIPGTTLAVSQVLSGVLLIASAAGFVILRKKNTGFSRN